MIKKTIYLATLCVLCVTSLFAQKSDVQSSSIFVQWDGLDKGSYATLKVAFNENDHLDLSSICLGDDLLCIEGDASDDQVWLWAKELIEATYPDTQAVWKSEMTALEYIELSKSYRLKPSE